MKRKLKWIIIPLAALAILLCAFLVYTGIYYHADSASLAAMKTDETVRVNKTDYGWFFDGPSEDRLLVFYPGAKVEESAYAPLLRRLGENGIDVCLVSMPFRLAIFGINKAKDVFAQYDYPYRYIGGHSMGGAMASIYAAEHSGDLNGVILLAAYPSKQLDDHLLLLSVYGSEDGVLNLKKVEEGRQYAPTLSMEYVIQGGNHAQFGNYGKQKGDGEACVSSEEQQETTVEFIVRNLL